jgi:dihydrolipoamide dehydrogenase
MMQVREVTDDYVLINGGELGTTCARVGCMPSKVLIQIADDFHRRQVLQQEGISGGGSLAVDVGRALDHVRKLRDGFVGGIIDNLINPLGDRFIDGYAEFKAPNVLQVGKTEIRAAKVVIASGSRPVIFDHWHRFKDRILTTDTLFEQQQLPCDLAVIGLGPVGLEIGQALRRLGLNVTGFDLLPQIGGLQDPEVNRTAVEVIGRDFLMHLGAEVQIEESGGRLRITSGADDVLVDKVLVSVGRTPNIDGLHLERLGIELDDRGLPSFDRATMQVDAQPIFIAGDVNDDRPVLHEVDHEGKVAGFNAVHEPPLRFRRKAPLVICFTDPNICITGAGWNEVEKSHPAIGSAKFDGGREKIMLRDYGLLRIYADRQTGKLVGAELAAPDGEHLTHLLCWSIQQELTVFELLGMPMYHPTVEETLKGALVELAEAVVHGKPQLLGAEVDRS